MQNINFYDPSLRLKRNWAGEEAALALLIVTAGAVAAAGFWVRHETKGLQATATAVAAACRAKQDAVAMLETRISGARADAALEHRLLGLQATLDHRTEGLRRLGSGALRQEGGYAAALLALARQSVDGLWLTTVTMDHGSMTLRGRTFRPELIAIYAGRLNVEAALRGQTFRALDVRRPAEEAPTAVVASDTPPAPQTPHGTARRLAPYVEFSLTGSRDDGAEPVGTGAPDLRVSSAAATAPGGSR